MSGIMDLLRELAEFGERLSQGPRGRTQSPSLLDGCPRGVHPLTRNVLPSLPAALSPAKVPIGAVENPARAATPGLTAAPPLPLEAAGRRQASEGHLPLGLGIADDESQTIRETLDMIARPNGEILAPGNPNGGGDEKGERKPMGERAYARHDQDWRSIDGQG